MANCLIALGSNLGDRRGQLEQAVASIESLPGSRIVTRSQWLETPPVGGPDKQSAFLNGAVRIDTDLEPAALHARLLEIEETAGRQRRVRWGARTLDLDLLLYDERQYASPALQIPHPRMTFRRFVLQGAAEAAAWMRHPWSGWTVGQLLRHLDRAPRIVAIAAANGDRARRLAAALARPAATEDGQQNAGPRDVQIVVVQPDDPLIRRAKLTIFLLDHRQPRGGRGTGDSDKLQAPEHCGPAAMVPLDDDDESAAALAEARAAVAAAWLPAARRPTGRR